MVHGHYGLGKLPRTMWPERFPGVWEAGRGQFHIGLTAATQDSRWASKYIKQANKQTSSGISVCVTMLSWLDIQLMLDNCTTCLSMDGFNASMATYLVLHCRGEPAPHYSLQNYRTHSENTYFLLLHLMGRVSHRKDCGWHFWRIEPLITLSFTNITVTK